MRSVFFSHRSVARTALTIASASLLVCIASCGADDGTTKSCVLGYEKASETAGAESTEVVYRATFSTECKDVYTKNSGRSNLTLKVVSKGADNMYVQTLVAGERSFAFLSKNSLSQGTFQSSFSSDTDSKWAMPWTDAPGTSSVTVIVPKGVDKSQWPTTVTLQIDAAGS